MVDLSTYLIAESALERLSKDLKKSLIWESNPIPSRRNGMIKGPEVRN